MSQIGMTVATPDARNPNTLLGQISSAMLAAESLQRASVPTRSSTFPHRGEGLSLFSPSQGGTAVATTDKAKNTAQQAKGKLKEATGKLTGNDKLRAEGKADETKGNLKQAGEKVKDAFKK